MSESVRDPSPSARGAAGMSATHSLGRKGTTVSYPAGGPGSAPPPQVGGPGTGQQYQGQGAYPPYSQRPAYPPRKGPGKGLLAAIAGAAVVAVAAVVLVVVAPWSSGGAAGTDMSTDESGNDVATMTLAFHPAWEWETSMASRGDVDTSQYPNWEDPPKTVTWVAVDLDAATATEVAMTFDKPQDQAGNWMPAGDAAAYRAAHFYRHGTKVTDNYDADGIATFAAFGQIPPADADDLENRLALEGGVLNTGGESPMSLWENGPGFYLGFKTKAGSLGYITVTQVREGADRTGGPDERKGLDLTIAVTYFTRAG